MNTIPQPYDLQPLSPKIDYSKFIKLSFEAREALARYDEAAKRLPNPEIIKRSFMTKEATVSTQIEGTQITVDEVLSFDAEKTDTEITEKEKDYREVSNYREAITESVSILKERPIISEAFIKQINKILLNSVRGSHRTPGEFRDIQVHIGEPGSTIHEAAYIPPAPQDIKGLFSNLTDFIHDESIHDPLVQAAIIHFQFEAIHPFRDGNGRTGRILVPIFLYYKELTTYPNLYISEFFEEYRSDYINYLRGVTSNGDLESWIIFFLRAIREQSKKLYSRVNMVDKLYRDIHGQLPSFNSIYAPAFLDNIFSTPTFTAKTIAENIGVSVQQIYKLIDKFEEKGLIRNITPGYSRNRKYSFQKLLDIIN